MNGLILLVECAHHIIYGKMQEQERGWQPVLSLFPWKMQEQERGWQRSLSLFPWKKPEQGWGWQPSLWLIL